MLNILTWVLNEFIIGGLSNMFDIGGLSNYVLILEGCPICSIPKGCPMNLIKGLSYELDRRVVQ